MAAIEVRNLTKTYGDTAAAADVSFDVGEGKIFGILGPNGAGKTTTVECVSGLRSPDSGGVRVLGLDPERDRARVRQMLGVQLQESQLPGKIQAREALEALANAGKYSGAARVGVTLSYTTDVVVTARPPERCSSARPRSRRTCCTRTPSSASATGPPRSPRRTSAACSSRRHMSFASLAAVAPTS